jgi:hypothetical protein
MAHDMFELFRKEEVEWSSQTAKPSEDGSRELCFLEQVITPVYQIVAAVSFRFTFLIMHCSSRMLCLLVCAHHQHAVQVFCQCCMWD